MAHLVARKLKTGTFWYVRYYADGKRGWLAAGKNRRQAERIRDTVARRLLDRKHGLEAPARCALTVAGFAETYLSRMDVLRPRSARWRRERMARVVDRLGGVLLEELSVGTLERYAADRRLEGKSAATVNSEIAVLRHAVGRAVVWREETGLHANRLTDWRQLKGPARRPRFLSPVEVERLLTASAVRGTPAHTFVRLFLATGARPGELLGLEEDDFQGQTVRLPALKGGAVRVVVVDSDLLDQAKLHRKEWSHQKVRTHWRVIRKLAGLHGVRFYDIRHTVASECLRRGATIRDVQRLLGHQTARMTERYAHFAVNAGALPGLTWGADPARDARSGTTTEQNGAGSATERGGGAVRKPN